MSSLEKIKHTVQKTAEAIADALKIEVEIADSNLLRVASTGMYKERCGDVMVEGFVYKYVLDTGNTVIIENPGAHELCKPCPHIGNCCESGEIAAPILLGDKPVGVIGLIGFDAAQAKQLMDNKKWIVQFLVKMAELIASNLSDENVDSDKSSSDLNLETLEKEAIIKALEEVSGNTGSKDKAAKLLGISRATLYRKLKEYEIE